MDIGKGFDSGEIYSFVYVYGKAAPKINSLRFYFKKIEKEEQINLKQKEKY